MNGVETGKLRKVDKKYLVRFEMLCWVRMEFSYANRVRNVEILHRVEDRNILNTTKSRKEGMVRSHLA